MPKPPSISEVLEELQKVAQATEGMVLLRDAGYTFEEVVELFMKQHKTDSEFTTKHLEQTEQLTGVKLKRKK